MDLLLQAIDSVSNRISIQFPQYPEVVNKLKAHCIEEAVDDVDILIDDFADGFDASAILEAISHEIQINNDDKESLCKLLYDTLSTSDESKHAIKNNIITNLTVSETPMGSNHDNAESKLNDPFKLHIAIDFGTDGLGLAYSFENKVLLHSTWNSDKYRDVVKPKLIILLDENGECDQFGLDARDVYMKLGSKRNNWMLFDRFKMSLYDTESSELKNDNNSDKINLRENLIAANGTSYPSKDVFIATFKYIQKETKKFLRRQKIKISPLYTQYILTVPAIWNDTAKNKMREWIIAAGLVDNNIVDQCQIVYEPDAASLSIHYKIRNNKLNEDEKQVEGGADIPMDINLEFTQGKKYILIDAGGGTVDIAVHEIVGQFGVKELLPPSGGAWGSCYIDDGFMYIMNEIFGKELMIEFKKKYANIYVQIIHNFQPQKATFYENRFEEIHCVQLPSDFIGYIEDKCDELQDIQDAEQIVNESKFGKGNLITLDGETLKMNKTIWISLFDQVINPIIDHVKQLLTQAILQRNCNYICLVGGMSNSKYFQWKIKDTFGWDSNYKMQIIIPCRPILSVVEGAARLGISKEYIKARRIGKTYGITMSWDINVAKVKGIPLDYIESHKYYNNGKKCWMVTDCFYVLVHKGSEIFPDQKYIAVAPAHSDGVVTEILCSDMVDPKIKENAKVIAKYKTNYKFDKEKYVPVVNEFRFDETTIKGCTYLYNNPDIKQEVVLKYE